MKNVFLTGDTHYGHKGIILHCARPFANTEEMDEEQIDSCNATVGRNDVLIHCGDFCWKASKAGHFRQRLKVRELHMLRGNHDAASLRKHVSTFDYMLFRKIGERHFHFAHFPLESWDHGAYHLHGHSHGRMRPLAGRLDVGVDVAYKRFGRYRPFSLEEVLEMLLEIESIPRDIQFGV